MRQTAFWAAAAFIALFAFSACAGNTSGGAVPQNRLGQSLRAGDSPTPSPTPNGKLTVTVGHGEINGTDDQFTGGVGKEVGDGDYPAGGQGPVGTSFKGPDAKIPCLTYMYSGPVPPGYHVHTFVGIYVNGSEVALPDGLGIAAPNKDITYKGIPNWTQNSYNPKYPSKPGCFYQMHTHDPSGLIHVESSNPNGIPQTGTMYTLGDFLALWGIPVNQSAGQFGPFTGTMQIYTSGPVSRGGSGGGEVGSNQYSLYTGDIKQIPLYSHEVIWILIGSGNPVGASLPNVAYWDEW